MTRSSTKTLAQGNAARLARLFDTEEGYADIYRTHSTGISGRRMRWDVLTGRVRIARQGGNDLTVVMPPQSWRPGAVAGWLRWSYDKATDRMRWAASENVENGPIQFIGYHDGIADAVYALTGVTNL